MCDQASWNIEEKRLSPRDPKNSVLLQTRKRWKLSDYWWEKLICFIRQRSKDIFVFKSNLVFSHFLQRIQRPFFKKHIHQAEVQQCKPLEKQRQLSEDFLRSHSNSKFGKIHLKVFFCLHNPSHWHWRASPNPCRHLVTISLLSWTSLMLWDSIRMSDISLFSFKPNVSSRFFITVSQGAKQELFRVFNKWQDKTPIFVSQ